MEGGGEGVRMGAWGEPTREPTGGQGFLMRSHPFLEPGSPHPTCLPRSPFLPMSPICWPESHPTLQAVGQWQGCPSGGHSRGGTTDPHRERPPPGSGPAPVASGGVQGRHLAGEAASRDTQVPAPRGSCAHPTASADALEPSLSLHDSEAGPAAPPKGSFLSHLPWPREVRSDSSPAP